MDQIAPAISRIIFIAGQITPAIVSVIFIAGQIAPAITGEITPKFALPGFRTWLTECSKSTMIPGRQSNVFVCLSVIRAHLWLALLAVDLFC